ncbi:MAG: hypothetical protein ACX936_20715 [Marinobacter sp.]
MAYLSWAIIFAVERYISRNRPIPPTIVLGRLLATTTQAILQERDLFGTPPHRFNPHGATSTPDEDAWIAACNLVLNICLTAWKLCPEQPGNAPGRNKAWTKTLKALRESVPGVGSIRAVHLLLLLSNVGLLPKWFGEHWTTGDGECANLLKILELTNNTHLDKADRSSMLAIMPYKLARVLGFENEPLSLSYLENLLCKLRRLFRGNDNQFSDLAIQQQPLLKFSQGNQANGSRSICILLHDHPPTVADDQEQMIISVRQNGSPTWKTMQQVGNEFGLDWSGDREFPNANVFRNHPIGRVAATSLYTMELDFGHLQLNPLADALTGPISFSPTDAQADIVSQIMDGFLSELEMLVPDMPDSSETGSTASESDSEFEFEGDQVPEQRGHLRPRPDEGETRESIPRLRRRRRIL